MGHDIRVTRIGSSHLAVVRRRSTAPELARVVPEACGAVWNALRSRGIRGAGRNVALYLDGEINMEIGVEMDAPFARAGEVFGSTTPAGTVAALAHFGPYDTLSGAHASIHAWCAERGHSLVGPSWEVYGHWRDEWNSDPSKIRTDIYYLIRAERGTREGNP